MEKVNKTETNNFNYEQHFVNSERRDVQYIPSLRLFNSSVGEINLDFRRGSYSIVSIGWTDDRGRQQDTTPDGTIPSGWTLILYVNRDGDYRKERYELHCQSRRFRNNTVPKTLLETARQACKKGVTVVPILSITRGRNPAPVAQGELTTDLRGPRPGYFCGLIERDLMLESRMSPKVAALRELGLVLGPNGTSQKPPKEGNLG